MNVVRRHDGVAMVELALVLPLLALLIFGFLELGFTMNAKIDETHLTAEGARYAIVDQNPALTNPINPKDCPGNVQTLQRYVRCHADTTGLQVVSQVCLLFPTNSKTGTSGQVGDPVTVTMKYAYQAITAYLPSPTLEVDSDATMRLEALPTMNSAGCYP